MVDLGKLSAFIAAMDGETAEISKTTLVAIEQELSVARRALSGLCVADGLAEFYRQATPAAGEATS